MLREMEAADWQSLVKGESTVDLAKVSNTTMSTHEAPYLQPPLCFSAR